MAIDERSKALYQPWNEEGFLADIRVRKMTQIQRWIYRALLQQAFVCTTRPRLPDDDEQLWMLADCKDLKQWLANKDPVIKMFDKGTIDDTAVLIHRRLEDDWNRILEIRESRSEAGKRSGEQRRARAEQKLNTCSTKSNKPEQVSNESNEENINEKEEEDEPSTIPSDETDMKSEKLIAIHCQTILRTAADLSENNRFILRALDTEYKGSVVARTFEDWAREHRHDEIRKPVSAFAKVAHDLLSAETPLSREVEENPVVKKAGREIAYLSDNKIALDPKTKAILKVAVEEEGYTFDEVIQAFKEFFHNLDLSNPKNVSFAAQNFVKEASDRLYAIRRKAAEKAAEQAAVLATKEKLAQSTSEDIQARLAALDREKAEAEDELPE